MQYRTSKQEFLFYLIFAVYILACVLSMSVLVENGGVVIKGLKYLCYLGCVIKILMDGFSEKKLWCFIIIAFLTVMTTVSTGTTMYFLFFLIFMAAKNVNLSRLMKIACWVQGISVFAIIGLSQLGIIEDHIFDPNERIRHGLGFSWTTLGPSLVFFFTMTYLYLRREKAHLVEYIILELIAYWLYVQTNTRMCFMITTVFLIWTYLMKYYLQNRGDKIRRNWILIAFPTIICLLSIFIHVGYNADSSLWTKLNDILSGRLQLGQSAFQKYGVALFGQKITWVGYGIGATSGEYNYVDSAYMQTLIQYGVIALIVIIALYTFIMYMSVRLKDYYLQAVLVFTLLISVTEPRLLDFNFNVFPILAVAFFTHQERDLLYQKPAASGIQVRFQMPRIRVKNRG